MAGLSFTEELAGWLSFEDSGFNEALLAGRRARRTAKLHLTITIDDLERFLRDSDHPAQATGWLGCGELGGRLTVEAGRFQLFVETPDAFHLRMRYRLRLRAADGADFTLVGFKLVENDLGVDHWADVTTLFVRVYPGRIPEGPPGEEPSRPPLATGVVTVGFAAFARQLASFRSTANTRLGRLADIGRFQAFFLAKEMLAYGGPRTRGLPSFPRERPPVPAPPAWQPVLGQPGLARRIVSYTTDDGVALKLDHLRRDDAPPPTRGPVLLAHGAGMRGQMFYTQPSGPPLATALLEAGYDVWVEHWRGSIDVPTETYTLDEVARYDHPAAVATILHETGAKTVKAVVHCQGSVSFTMAAVTGLLPAVTHVVATGVSLHIQVPREAREKQLVMLGLATRLTPWIDAQWAIRPVTPQGRGLARMAALPPTQQRLVGALMRRLAALHARRGGLAPLRAGESAAPSPAAGHRDPAEHPVLRMAHFMYGAGADVFWRGENVAAANRAWVGSELGSAPLRLFDQIKASTGRGHIVPAVALEGLPRSYVHGPPRTTAHFTFIVGDANRMFLPAGMRATFAYFDRHAPAHHAFVELEGFGHADLLLGREAPARTYPAVLAGLERTGAASGLAAPPAGAGADADDEEDEDAPPAA